MSELQHRTPAAIRKQQDRLRAERRSFGEGCARSIIHAAVERAGQGTASALDVEIIRTLDDADVRYFAMGAREYRACLKLRMEGRS